MENYVVIGRIGEGAHGIVMQARHKMSGHIVALKKIPLKRLEDGISEATIREIRALQQLDSIYVVKMLDVFPQGLGFVLVFEFMMSDLAELIKDAETPLKEPEIKSYMLMLLKGVEYLHRNNIMHRDLKPANLLVSKDCRLKIADFGLCCIIEKEEDTQYSHQVATRWYRAPELLYGARQYNEGVDLWAVGCILGEMFNNCPLFPGENDIDQLGLVIRHLGTPTEEVWPGVSKLPDYSKITFPDCDPVTYEEMVPETSLAGVDLLKQFIIYNSSQRMSAKEAINHHYFYEKPFPVPRDEMTKPREKRFDTNTNDIEVDLPFHSFFNKLLDIV